jgi:hypothetical protein
VTGKQLRDPAYDAWRVDPALELATRGNAITKNNTHVWLLKSFIMSKNRLYTSGCS